MTLRHPPSTARHRLLDTLPLEERRLEINGLATSVLEGGDGPPMLLLHGAIQIGGVVWWRVIPRLAGSFRLVVPDLPGLGETAPAARLDTSAVTGWLSGLIEHTSTQPPTLVAHSAPGGLAARYAVEHSDRLRRLILVDAAGLGPFRPSPGLLVALVRSMARPSERNFERFMGRVMHDLDRVRVDTGEQWKAFTQYAASRAVLPSVKQAMRQLPKSASRPIPHEDLRKITVPTTLLWGRHDQLVPLRVGEAASNRHGWPLHAIDDVGHLPHVERPHTFVDALTEATQSA